MIKKINLRGISEILSEKELKNVMGGSGESCTYCNRQSDCSSGKFCGRWSGRCENRQACF